MFEAITKREIEKKKCLENLSKALKKGELKVAAIDEKLNKAIESGDMDNYQVLMTEKNSLEVFVEKTNAKITEIKNSPAHTEADLEEIKTELQKKYNKKLKVGHEKLRTALENVLKTYEEYQNVSSEFLNDRADFNSFNSVIGTHVSLYEGPNKIANDDIAVYKPIIAKINLALNNNNVE